MSDTPGITPGIITTSINDDAFWRTSNVTDGGNTGGGDITKQSVLSLDKALLTTVSLQGYTPHYNLAAGHDHGVLNERAPFGNWALNLTKVTAQATDGPLDRLSSNGIEADYNEVHLSSKVQAAIHAAVGMGHDYRTSPVHPALHGSLQHGETLRWNIALPAGLELKPAAVAAVNLGDTGAAVMAGAHVTLGRHVDGLPELVPAANPELAGLPYTRNANQLMAGAFKLEAGITQQHLFGGNALLRDGEAVQHSITAMTAGVAVALSKQDALGVSFTRYTNPVDTTAGHGLSAEVPRLDKSTKISYSHRF